MVTQGRRTARIWGSWCVELLNLDGRPRLWVNDGRYLAGHCTSSQGALDVGTRASGSIDQLTRERDDDGQADDPGV